MSYIPPPCRRSPLCGAAAGSFVVWSRRAAASQELAIQVGTPNRGRTHLITTKYAASKMAKVSHSVMNSTLIEMHLREIGDTDFPLVGRAVLACPENSKSAL
jgi:hypothetical protein